MKKTTRKLLSGIILAGLALPLAALAADDDAKRIEELEAKVKKLESKSLGKWLTISGDYRFRYDYLKGKVAPYADGMTVFGNVPTVMGLVGNGTIDVSGLNQQQIQQLVFGTAIQGGTFGTTTLPSAQRNAHNVENTSLYSNRFGLNLKAKATEDVTVTARLLMYKFAGAQDDSALRDGNTAYSLDRAGLFDGTIGHVPSDSKLAVDRVYATWNNIAEQPIWFSIGRRPSTGGVPAHLRQNTEKPGNSGVPALLVDYAFDGVTVGYAPEIEALPGAYAKLCYGRGFQDSIQSTNSNGLHNTDMIGLNVVPYETDALRVELQYNYGMEIFDAPKMLTGPFPLSTTKNLGNIHWAGLDFLGTVKHLGIGDLTWFAAGAMSRTDVNGKTLEFNGLDSGYGLLFTGTPEDVTGWAAYFGGRYDIEASRTKIGFEYNHGSKNWITFAPAADDMWTSKVGVRGNVYEGYVIQELPLEPISSYLSKAFFKLGYQYYDFEYTGSNSWLGAPVKISELNSMFPQLTAPLDSAQNLYVTFEVHF